MSGVTNASARGGSVGGRVIVHKPKGARGIAAAHVIAQYIAAALEVELVVAVPGVALTEGADEELEGSDVVGIEGIGDGIASAGSCVADVVDVQAFGTEE